MALSASASFPAAPSRVWGAGCLSFSSMPCACCCWPRPWAGCWPAPTENTGCTMPPLSQAGSPQSSLPIGFWRRWRAWTENPRPWKLRPLRWPHDAPGNGKAMSPEIPSDHSEAQAGNLSEIRIQVRYSETDAMKFVYYANYLIYFEVARTSALAELGHPYWE